jgi:hypothetical protein
VSFKNTQTNPEYVLFKDTEQAEQHRYSGADCASFGVKNSDSYEYAVVNISMNTVNINRVRERSGTSADTVLSRRAGVFLKILQRGESVALFSYTDKLKTRYYLQDREQSVPVELVMNLYSDLGNIVVERIYLRQLLLQMRKHIPGLSMRDENINRTQYTEGDLLEVVSKINAQHYEKHALKSLKFFAGIGVNQSSIKYTGGHVLAKSAAVSKASISPLLVLGIDVPFNPDVGRLLFRVDLSLLRSKNEISSETSFQSYTITSHAFNQTSIALCPQVRYYVYNKRNLKLFVGTGIGAVASGYDKNISYIRYQTGGFPDEVKKNLVELDKFSVLYKLCAGVMFNRKVELSAGYYPSSAIANYNGFKVKISRLNAGVFYHFSK